MRPSQPDPTAVTYEFPIRKDFVLMGGAVVDMDFGTTATDVPLGVRVWDVAADGTVQGLVTRGIYRVDAPPGPSQNARFQIAAQGYRFDAGHRLKVEVTANDAPYHQASTVAASVTVDRLSVTLPVFEKARPTSDAATSSPGVATRSSTRMWRWWIALAATAAAVAIVLIIRRRRPPTA